MKFKLYCITFNYEYLSNLIQYITDGAGRRTDNIEEAKFYISKENAEKAVKYHTKHYSHWGELTILEVNCEVG